MGTLLSSAVVAAFVAALFSVLTSERRIAAENVIQERKNWRNEIRALSSEVCEALSRPDGDDNENKLRDLRAKLLFLLNPHDAEDKEILALDGRTKAEEFSDRVRLLLKHDWERAKREASLLRWLCEREPQRVTYEKFKPGGEYDYRERRWFVLFAALLGVVGGELLFGEVGIKGIWWRTVEGPVWKNMNIAGLVMAFVGALLVAASQLGSIDALQSVKFVRVEGHEEQIGRRIKFSRITGRIGWGLIGIGFLLQLLAAIFAAPNIVVLPILMA
jgi:hypothetical protein